MASLTAQTHSHLGNGMLKKTEWTKERRSQAQTELAISFVKFQMCWYHMAFHLDLEFEHNLDVHLSGRRSDLFS